MPVILHRQQVVSGLDRTAPVPRFMVVGANLRCPVRPFVGEEGGPAVMGAIGMIDPFDSVEKSIILLEEWHGGELDRPELRGSIDGVRVVPFATPIHPERSESHWP